jgi:serine/threonine protein kinase
VTASSAKAGWERSFWRRIIGRKVAVKVLRQELAANTEMLRRFFLEARSTASLRHPALVDVLDYGFHANGSPYIVMEYIEGESLAARIERIGRLSIATTLEISHRSPRHGRSSRGGARSPRSQAWQSLARGGCSGQKPTRSGPRLRNRQARNPDPLPDR